MSKRLFEKSVFASACFVIGLFSGTPLRAETWHRADSHHFKIYSDGSAAQLEDFTREVEKFDGLLRLLFRRPVKEETVKLPIYLLRDGRQVDAYMKNAVGFYSVRLGQTFAVANRDSRHGRTALDGKTVLFHEYAHHFMFHNFAIPAPAWFVEGFAEYVSTADFKKNGEWTFGFPAHHRAYSVQNGPKIPIERLLSDDYSAMNAEETAAFYGWSWALTHMFYSDPNERGNQIVRYLQDINSGMDSVASARKNFGDLDDLERQLHRYVRGSMGYTKTDKPIDYKDDVEIVTLNDAESDLTALTLERLASREPVEVRADLQRHAATSGSGKAWLQLAELEFSLAHRKNGNAPPSHDFTATEEAVDRALALDPSLPRAHILKGRLLMEPFDHSADPNPENWAAARAYFLAANKLDPLDPLALFLYAQTYQRSGERGEMVGPALEKAFEMRPEAFEFRSALAAYYANEHQYDRAIELLAVIANNPHSDNSSVKAFISQLEQARANGGTIAVDDIPTESEEDQELDVGV